MLSARITPSLVKYAQLRYASYQPVLMQTITTVKLSTCPVGREQSRFAATGVDHATVSRVPNYTIYRSYTSDQPKLPSKSELERVFFKVTVIIWDLVWKIAIWAWALFKKRIILNPTVQSYWKTFNQKLEDARRN